MAEDFIGKIKELNHPKVHIKDPGTVNQKLNEIVNGGFGRLQIVSDFDATITKQHENGTPHYSSYRMFRFCPSLSKEFLEMTGSLREKYVPIEFNPNIPLEEKKMHMEDWYKQAAQVFKDIKVTVSREELTQAVAKLNPPIRDGTKELFDLLHKKDVPVLVFSAGLGDAVEAVLKHHQVLHPNVHVVSNFFDYSEDGTIVGYKGALIHTFNKNEVALKGTPFYDLISKRDNVILMGDSIGDCNMAEGMPNSSHVLKIGFLYEQIEGNLPFYKDSFDIVLEDDQTMNVANAIIELINK